MSKDTSGPAFPVQDAASYQCHGLTMRDYFAAKALHAVYEQAIQEANESGLFQEPDWRLAIALDAFDMADAMLRARGAV